MFPMTSWLLYIQMFEKQTKTVFTRDSFNRLAFKKKNNQIINDKINTIEFILIFI